MMRTFEPCEAAEKSFLYVTRINIPRGTCADPFCTLHSFNHILKFNNTIFV